MSGLGLGPGGRGGDFLGEKVCLRMYSPRAPRMRVIMIVNAIVS